MFLNIGGILRISSGTDVNTQNTNFKININSKKNAQRKTDT